MRLGQRIECRREELAVCRLCKGSDLRRADICHDGQVEERAHRRAHHLVAKDIDRSLRQDNSRRTDGISRADDRACIAGVLHAVEHDEERLLCTILLPAALHHACQL